MCADLALILAGGDCPSPGVLAEVRKKDLWVLCADSGADHAWKLGIRPDCICGDMDSIDPRVQDGFREMGVPFSVYPSEKDQTDLEIALDIVADRGISSVYLAGLEGGRTDHMIANYLLAGWYSRRVEICILGRDTRAYYLNETCPERVLEGVRGRLVSLVPLEPCAGVGIRGCRYPLEHAVLEPGRTTGVSNRAVSERVRVSLESGLLLVFAGSRS